MKVAFIGLGVMGGPMAGHLAKAGHEISVFNRSPAKASAWAEANSGRVSNTAAEAVRGAELIGLCVGNDDDVRALVTGFLPSVDAGAVIVDHTTTSAKLAREMSGICARSSGRVSRRAGLGGGSRSQGRYADRHGRRRRGRAREGRGGAGVLLPRDPPDRRVRLGAARQDGEPDLHCGSGPGPGRGGELRAQCRPRRGSCLRRHLQGRRPVLADGQSLEDHGGGQLRIRLRRGLDAQGLGLVLDEARANGSRVEVTALVDQFYAEVQAMGGRRWDTSSLAARLAPR